MKKISVLATLFILTLAMALLGGCSQKGEEPSVE